MKQTKDYSVKALRRIKWVSYVSGGIAIALGIISFVVGGIIFIIPGVILIANGLNCENTAREKEKAEKEQQELIEKRKAEQKQKEEEIAARQQALEAKRKEDEEKERKRQIEQAEKATRTETYKVAGISFYEEDLLELAYENDEYHLSKKELLELGYSDMRIYEYDFYPVKTELVPDPDNEHDPNAIKVIVDNTRIGYIAKESCTRVHDLLKQDKIEKVTCEISGGKYKYIGYDSIKKESAPFFAKVHILLKKES